MPVLLPPVAGVEHAVDRCDGVLLSGGPDVAADRYGAPAHPGTFAAHPDRDTAELAVLHRALTLDLPVLGVCRGAQLLNVALAARCTSTCPTSWGTTGTTRRRGCSPTSPCGSTRPRGSAGHSGARSGTGCGCAVTTTRPWTGSRRARGDGLGRGRHGGGARGPGAPVLVGVQWHPEQDAADTRLVAALVAAAIRRGRRR